METVDILLEQHAGLSRRLAELEAMLGPGGDAGWDDCTDCDMARFRSTLKDFLAELRAHEAAETRALGRVIDAPGPERRKKRMEYAKSHEALDHLVKLLGVEATIDHGRHVYSIRHIAARVRDELESHLAREERETFPLLRRESKGLGRSAA